MLFGAKNSFAIEAVSEPTLEPPSAVWGRMRVWCQNASIGNFADKHCGLYPSYKGCVELLESLPGLWERALDGLSDRDLWNRVDGLLYGYHGDVEIEDNRTQEEYRADWERWGGHNFLTNWGEQFERGGKSFIFCREGMVIILNRSLPQGRGIRLQAPLDDVMNAIRGFVGWFESEAARLSGGTDA